MRPPRSTPEPKYALLNRMVVVGIQLEEEDHENLQWIFEELRRTTHPRMGVVGSITPNEQHENNEEEEQE